jgi:hypothetical protein
MPLNQHNENLKFIDVSTPGDVTDALGRARADLSEAQARVKFLEGILKAGTENAINGALFRATVSRDVTKETTDWKTIAYRLGEPSRQLIKAHTKVSVYDQVRVSALKKGE